MRQLAVNTCTTVEELALFIHSLPPNSMLGGVPGEDGTVMLYAANATASSAADVPLRDRLAARVAVDVVLQQVAGMPGAVELLRNVEEQFEGDHGARVGWLLPPLTILSRIYRKTMNALPDPALPGHQKHYFSRYDGERDDPSPSGLKPDQIRAIEHLIDKLFLFSKPGRVHGRLEDAGTD
ncbi:hypothetical protein [Noviherbaspirillum soli]|uniref:hypothetical protein n=1 Tax=Noviherbaspirillum soli TaxID=1064518 RepID=UPI00188D40C9|nr:hypothetical protein [Noviherbaspirillum soli]